MRLAGTVYLTRAPHIVDGLPHRRIITPDYTERPTAKMQDNHNYFNFAIVNFPFLSIIIPISQGDYQLLRYVGACSGYQGSHESCCFGDMWEFLESVPLDLDDHE